MSPPISSLLTAGQDFLSGPAAAASFEALYSEKLRELAVKTGLFSNTGVAGDQMFKLASKSGADSHLNASTKGENFS